jgi:uncharacterized protein YvpB
MIFQMCCRAINFLRQRKSYTLAISLGGKDFIHQSGRVHITSFDPNSPYYEESYGKKIKAIKRFFRNH